ncbi:hypothetical protein I8748_21060 [Nostoc sp. CENA67]|uniref:Uncharacterized protein n=1 Tax=Amazonocrinis nigriterrae CENA67 TaxID=2794033 RepID=A0A8J7HY73_9NOST|nr:hypothetical protein [Amazonocrinis nigriterrae]MBH8564644.1 hypothetical protein [Amazonocrinis nigriterrae CENA67]
MSETCKLTSVGERNYELVYEVCLQSSYCQGRRTPSIGSICFHKVAIALLY